MTTKIGVLRSVTIETATATVYTSHGDIVIDLFGNHTPNTADNFIGLAEGAKEYKGQNALGIRSGPFYDEATFHRIIAGSVIQGDNPLGTGTGGPGYMFDGEIHPELQFDRPHLFAMVNADRHSGRGTDDSQFFITVVSAPHLNGAHTIFGEVVDDASREVVDEITRVATDHWGHPLEPVVITSIDIEK